MDIKAVQSTDRIVIRRREAEFYVCDIMEMCLECPHYSEQREDEDFPTEGECSLDWNCDQLQCPDSFDDSCVECRACDLADDCPFEETPEVIR